MSNKKCINDCKNIYHYVYQILEISSKRKYIGVRSSKALPEEDLGVKYFSSSKDKEFIERQKHEPANYQYIVLSTHITREEALAEEVRLHELYDVGINEEYINRAKSTESGFDFSGITVCLDENDQVILSTSKNDNLKTYESKYVIVRDGNHTFKISRDDPRYLSNKIKHFRAKTFLINGIYYESGMEAARMHNCRRPTITERCKNPKFKHYSVL